MMKYKGYTAEVEFDESVSRLHGRVVNLENYFTGRYMLEFDHLAFGTAFENWLERLKLMEKRSPHMLEFCRRFYEFCRADIE